MPASEQFDHLSTDFKEVPNASTKHKSIKVTHRTDRTFYTYILHLLVRRIRHFLGNPPKEQHDGSTKLTPMKIIYKTCTVSERRICDIYIYDIIPRKIKGTSYTKRIYYFAGGGWQSPPSAQHWQLCAKIARQMPDTAISMVSIPLAPKNDAPITFPWLMKLYRALLEAAEEEGHTVILAGDSSGGNIVLSLVLEALHEDEEIKAASDHVNKHIPHAAAIMAISPSTDLTRSNPKIEELQQFDPFLTPDFIKATAKTWRGEWDATDRRVSPIFADVSLLARRGIRVHGITGGYDILAPDSIAFRDRLVKEGVAGEWLEWEKQMHCFPLTWPYGFHEGRESVGWMIDIMSKEGKTA